MDCYAPEIRRKTMQAIGQKDTSIEVVLRKELWKRGLRYRKNCRDLPGKPDIVFRGAKVAVFCDSEFWHGYKWEENNAKIGTNRDYWIKKIERTMERDNENDEALKILGYSVLHFWGKEITKDPSRCADVIEETILHQTALNKQPKNYLRIKRTKPPDDCQ